jgi:septal ring factor EnvC (AmiA/AmiB activator)
MRLFRALCTAVALALVLSTVVSDGFAARAQSVGEAEDDADRAAREAEQASGLVESAVANRSAIESDLLSTITLLNDLSAELSSLSVDLDTLSEQLGFADLELAGIEADIEVRAVDAYMSALSGQSIAVVNSDNVEEALVTGLVVGDIVNAGRRDIDGLVLKKRDLEKLYERFLSQQEQVAAKQAEFDAAKEHLAALYDEADADVASAVRAADEADAAYRAALSEIDAANARAAGPSG